MKAAEFSCPAWLVFVYVVVACSLLGGCMPTRVNLLQTGAMSFRTDAPTYLDLSAAVYAESDTLVVYGTASERFGIVIPLVGHVDVEVMGSDGALLYVQSVPYRVASTTKGMFRRATFRARFPAVPPQGAVLTLRHHRGIHTG